MPLFACPRTFIRLQSPYKRYTKLQRVSFRIVYVCQFSLPPLCWKVENIKDLLAPLTLVHFSYPPRPIHTAKGSGTPKLGRVFLVLLREKEKENGVITSTQFTCFPRPIFFPLHLFQPIKFWSTFYRKRTKKQTKKKRNYGQNSIFFFIPFSF